MSEQAITAIKDFKQVGQILRKKREEHSYTLEHVAEITRITLSNLRFIEAGDLKQLPSLVFVRGFVRNYANLLGLESDWMVEVLNQAYDNDPTSSMTNRPDPQPVQARADHNHDGILNEKNTLVLAGGALLLVLIIAIFLLGSGGGTSDDADVIQAIETPGEPDTAAPAEGGPAAAPASLSALILTAVAKRSDWIEIKVDGKPAELVQLDENKKYEWPAEEGYEVTLSTGASAALYLNGDEVVVKKGQEEDLFQAKLTKLSTTQHTATP